jgi:hypothetical protein
MGKKLLNFVCFILILITFRLHIIEETVGKEIRYLRILRW